MATENHSVISQALEWVPGFLALLAAAVGYGRHSQRLKEVEDDVADIRVTSIREDIAMLKERSNGIPRLERKVDALLINAMGAVPPYLNMTHEDDHIDERRNAG